MTDFELHRRALDCIAHGYLTNSKRPETFVKGIYPTHVSHGRGAHLWDYSGKQYVDFICGLGTNLLGYGNERLVNAVGVKMRGGWSHSFATKLEIETAEMVKAAFPVVDLLRFVKTGSDACSAAIKIARAATGRDIVLSDGYHGMDDEFIGLTKPAHGIPRAPRYPKAISKLDGFSDALENVAAIIVEPVVTDWSDERRQYLQYLRDACTKAGALLIFDEVITGLRWPRLSVASYWNITPDLICLGKAVAGGLPLAIVGGRRDVMNCKSEYFVSTTYGGEVLSLAACHETLRLLLSNTYDVQFLWDKGKAFCGRFNELAPGVVTIDGYPTRGVLKGEPLHKALFMQEACKAGFLFGPSWFWAFPHIDVAGDALSALGGILQRIGRGEVKLELEGEAPRSPFAQQQREKA